MKDTHKDEQNSLQRRERRHTPEPPPYQPRKPEKPKRGLQMVRVVLLCFIGVLVVLISREGVQYLSAQQEYKKYQQMEDSPLITAPAATEEPDAADMPDATDAIFTAIEGTTEGPVPSNVPEATPLPAGVRAFYSAKVDALHKANPDTVAWLDVGGTRIHYPVVRTEDNEYYLTRTFERKENPSGAIFMDFRNERELSDFNIILYGHNMKDGSMFYDLREFEHKTFLAKNPKIELTLRNSKRVYTTFAAYQRQDDFDFMGFSISMDVDKEQLITRILGKSTIHTNIRPTADDEILTLVTCTSGSHSWHWIVHAVLVEEVLTTQSLL